MSDYKILKAGDRFVLSDYYEYKGTGIMQPNPQRDYKDCHGVIKRATDVLYTVQFDNNIRGDFIISGRFLPEMFDTSGLEALI